MTHARSYFALIFLACASAMGFAFYLEYRRGLEPCPLCLAQRLFFIAVGLIALLAWVHGPRRIGQRIYSVLIGLFAAGGAAVAARHVWLQHLPPDQAPSCGPGLSYMLAHFPFMTTVQRVLGGSGECAQINWVFLGLSIPEWSLIAFLVLLAVSVAMFRAARAR